MRSTLLPFVLTCLGFCFLPTALTAALAWRHRSAWLDWRGAPPADAADDYRRLTRTDPTPRLPGSIVAVAWASFALGQMFLPGLCWGIGGLFVMGVGLVSIPGLIVAARCLRTGWLVLRRDAGASAFAETTAGWSWVLNLLVLGLATTAMVCCFGLDDWGHAPLILGTWWYAVISLLHARSLTWVARQLRGWSRSPERMAVATAGQVT